MKKKMIVLICIVIFIFLFAPIMIKETITIDISQEEENIAVDSFIGQKVSILAKRILRFIFTARPFCFDTLTAIFSHQFPGDFNSAAA